MALDLLQRASMASQQTLTTLNSALNQGNTPEPIATMSLQAADVSLEMVGRRFAEMEGNSNGLDGSALFRQAQSDVLGSIEDAIDTASKEIMLKLMMMGMRPEEASDLAKSMSGAATDMMAQPNAMPNATIAVINTEDLNINMQSMTIEGLTGPDGNSISVSLDQIELVSSSTTIAVVQIDPLIIDLDGDGIETSAVGEAAAFDLDGDGDKEQTGWVAGDDALLTLDRDGNGEIDTGKELFGDQHGAANGFEELAKFDDNQDGVIDNQDKVYQDLELLFADGNRQSLFDAGITKIELNQQTPVNADLAGGRLAETGRFFREDGSEGTVGEVYFDVSA